MMFTRLNKYIPRDFSVDVMMPDRAYKGLGSFAARMEQMQPTYVEALKKRGLPQNLSLYEMLALALKDRDLPDQIGLLPKTKAKILQWKQEAIYLLQIRHNYLPMLVLARMTDIQDRGDFRRALMAIRGQAVELDSADPSKAVSYEQLREWTYWLNQAVETRARLRALGIEPKYNKVMGTMLRAPNFGQDALLAPTPVGQPAVAMTPRRKALVDFAKAYRQVVEEMPNLMPDLKFLSLPSFPATPPRPFPEALPFDTVL